MPTATYTGLIRAPPEEVFAFIADVENNPTWHEHVRETRWIDEGPTRIGRRGRQFGHLWGRDWAFVAEVAEWDPPHRVAFQVVEGFRVRTSIAVELADGGASRVTLTVRTPRLPGPGVDAMASGLMKFATRNRESGDFRRLREALERPTGQYV
ncbi:MAG: SRPBCC family protein [Chloroflexota bacterium]